MKKEHFRKMSADGANHKRRGEHAVVWDDSGKIRRLIMPSNPTSGAQTEAMLETVFEYDEQDRLIETKFVSEADGVTTTDTEQLNAFLQNFRYGVVYDELGRVKAFTYGGVVHTEYEYDENNLISAIIYGGSLGQSTVMGETVGLDGDMSRKRHYKNGQFIKSEYRQKKGGGWKKMPNKGNAISEAALTEIIEGGTGNE